MALPLNLTGSAVPAAVWGTVFGAVWGSLFGLLSSTLAERWSAARAKAQREHDSQEKARDRNMTLRREVYLPLAADVNEALTFLSTMPTRTIEAIGGADPLSRLGAAASKLGLVASADTAAAANNFQTECGMLYLRFSPMAMEIAGIAHGVGVAERIRDEYLAEMGRLNTALAAMNASGQPDIQKFHAHMRQYEVAKDAFERQSLQINERNARRQALHLQYGMEFLPAMRQLYDAGLAVSVAMRRDLGQEQIGDSFVAQVKANIDRTYSVAEEMLRKMTIDDSRENVS